jgi:hypothetical protein
VLQEICEDPKTPVPMKLRACELVLSAYQLVSLDAERAPRHNGLKGLISARLDLSATDRTISGQLRQDRKRQAEKLREELTKL